MPGTHLYPSPGPCVLTILIGLGVGVAALAQKTQTQAEPPPKAPPGFVEMYVAGVMPAAEGTTLFLNDRDKKYFIPMGIGSTEALSIHLRLERRRFERPLTHDLLDSVLRELDGKIIKVHVDDLRGGIFVGRVFIRAKGRIVELDARPSDAIALALGSQVPIFVAQSVIDKAAIQSGSAAETETKQSDNSTKTDNPAPSENKPISL